MKFEMPKADRSRLYQLLEYLSQPCEHYAGNRAEDFKKSIDIESEWAWMYADLILRGLESRNLDYAEQHHIVQYSYYKMNGEKSGRLTNKMTERNMSSLTYLEHIYAHFILVKCSVKEMIPKNAFAFCHMWRTKHRCVKKHLPSEEEVLALITEEDATKIKMLQPHVAGVTKDGRTHSWEDIKQARRELAEKRKDIIKAKRKENYANNREEKRRKAKEYRDKNREHIRERNRKYADEHRDHIREREQQRRENNKEALREYSKKHYAENKDYYHEHNVKYRAEHYDEIMEYKENYRKTHKKEIQEYSKRYAAEKKAAGYAKRKDPVTGKDVWKYVADEKPKTPSNTKTALRSRKFRESKIKYGFSRRRNPDTGKFQWMYTGKLIKFRVNSAYVIPETIDDPEIVIKFASSKEYDRDYYMRNKERHQARCKEYQKNHKVEHNARCKKWREKKYASGFRLRKNPVTGKHEWVFVGLPKQEVAA